MKYNRVLLKLSGEALAGDDKTGINAHTVADIARQIKDAKDLGVEIAIVCGGGSKPTGTGRWVPYKSVHAPFFRRSGRSAIRSSTRVPKI